MASSGHNGPPRQTPIAIIGMGCLFPRASGLKAYWRLIRTSEDGVTDVPDTHWSLDDYFDPDPGRAQAGGWKPAQERQGQRKNRTP